MVTAVACFKKLAFLDFLALVSATYAINGNPSSSSALVLMLEARLEVINTSLFKLSSVINASTRVTSFNTPIDLEASIAVEVSRVAIYAPAAFSNTPASSAVY